jgi:hypothetical protein
MSSHPKQSKTQLVRGDREKIEGYSITETQLPMLPASEIVKLNEVHPGAAAVFVDAFKSEQEHRQKVDSRGQWLFFAIAVLSIVASVLGAFFTKSPWAMSGLLAVGIASIGTVIRK